MMNKLYKYISFLFVCCAIDMLFSACQYDEDDKFDTPAMQRLQEAVTANKQLLESASNGWRLYYFTGENYSGRGYTYFLRFAGGRVEVGSEAFPDQTSTSQYNVASDQGVVLTINTYNGVMHNLTEPNYEAIDGEQADFEFLIQKVSQDTIHIKGRKWGNKMLMVRMPADQTWKQYQDGIASYEHHLLRTYDLTVDGHQEGSIYFNPDARRATITMSGANYVIPFCTTPNGVYLAEPVGGVNGFAAQPQSLSLVTTDTNRDVRLVERITPEYLYTLLGNSAVGLPNYDASRTITNDIVSLFDFESDDDWIEVVKSGTSFTVKASDNTKGFIRRGSITVMVNGISEQMEVTQYDYEHDILGSYYLMYTDRDGEFQVDPVSMREGGGGLLLLDYTFYYDSTPVPLSLPFIFDADHASLSLYCGQLLGSLAQYSIYSVFADRDLSAWSSAATTYHLDGTYIYDEDGLYVSLAGTFGATDMPVGELLLMASYSQPLTSSSIAGYIGMLYEPVLFKTAETSSTARQAVYHNITKTP